MGGVGRAEVERSDNHAKLALLASETAFCEMVAQTAAKVARERARKIGSSDKTFTIGPIDGVTIHLEAPKEAETKWLDSSYGHQSVLILPQRPVQLHLPLIY